MFLNVISLLTQPNMNALAIGVAPKQTLIPSTQQTVYVTHTISNLVTPTIAEPFATVQDPLLALSSTYMGRVANTIVVRSTVTAQTPEAGTPTTSVTYSLHDPDRIRAWVHHTLPHAHERIADNAHGRGGGYLDVRTMRIRTRLVDPRK